MIRGVHAMFYTPVAQELRVFLRDKLGFPFTDTGGGWLIFTAPEAEIGCHEAQTAHHGLSFYCDDLPRTMAALKRRGVEFSAPMHEEEWGWVTRFRVPGGEEVELYQPKYRTQHARVRRPTSHRARRTRAKR